MNLKLKAESCYFEQNQKMEGSMKSLASSLDSVLIIALSWVFYSMVVVSSGHLHDFYVVFVPLEKTSTGDYYDSLC